MAVSGITEADLNAYYTKHFSAPATSDFASHFLGPIEGSQVEEEEEEDDGLGYYEDGVKRTLTDEQIAMFRHSEIQTLLRERRHATEGDASRTPSQAGRQAGVESIVGEGELEEEEDEDPLISTLSATTTQQRAQTKRNKKKKKKKSFFKEHIKPDLRKRTWDKVDTGLDSLDYGEASTAGDLSQSMAHQRRRISYDD